VYAILAPIFDANPILRNRYAANLSEKQHQEAVFDSLYPKMDGAVTRDQTHLHKLPLVLHPKSWNLCVLMGPVRDDRRRFRPSADCIQPQQIRQAHFDVGLRIIQEALKKS
jgi:DNA primase catalytic subunit